MTDEKRGFVFHTPEGDVDLTIYEVKELAGRDDLDGLYASGWPTSTVGISKTRRPHNAQFRIWEHMFPGYDKMKDYLKNIYSVIR